MRRSVLVRVSVYHRNLYEDTSGQEDMLAGGATSAWMLYDVEVSESEIGTSRSG